MRSHAAASHRLSQNAYLGPVENRLHQVIGIVLVLLFIAFAAVQYNDPDPWVWIAIYGGAAALIGASTFRRLPMAVSLLPMLGAIVGAIWLWPDAYVGLAGKMDSRPGVELARESLGLVIVAVACAYVLWRSWARRPATQP